VLLPDKAESLCDGVSQEITTHRQSLIFKETDQSQNTIVTFLYCAYFKKESSIILYLQYNKIIQNCPVYLSYFKKGFPVSVPLLAD
jgi:hypothetical protein